MKPNSVDVSHTIFDPLLCIYRGVSCEANRRIAKLLNSARTKSFMEAPYLFCRKESINLIPSNADLSSYLIGSN